MHKGAQKAGGANPHGQNDRLPPRSLELGPSRAGAAAARVKLGDGARGAEIGGGIILVYSNDTPPLEVRRGRSTFRRGAPCSLGSRGSRGVSVYQNAAGVACAVRRPITLTYRTPDGRAGGVARAGAVFLCTETSIVDRC